MTVAAFIANLRSRKFKVHADGDAIFVEPRGKLTPDDVERIKGEKPAILAVLNAPMPRLIDGRVAIGFDCDPRWQWWLPGAQTLAQTLADLDADAATIRRYLGRSDAPLHTAMGVRDCKGGIVELPEIVYCVECSWFYEPTLKDELGF